MLGEFLEGGLVTTIQVEVLIETETPDLFPRAATDEPMSCTMPITLVFSTALPSEARVV